MLYILYATILDQDSLSIFDKNEQFESENMDEIKEMIKLIKYFTDNKCKMKINVIDEDTGETVMTKNVA